MPSPSVPNPGPNRKTSFAASPLRKSFLNLFRSNRGGCLFALRPSFPAFPLRSPCLCVVFIFSLLSLFRLLQFPLATPHLFKVEFRCSNSVSGNSDFGRSLHAKTAPRTTPMLVPQVAVLI